VPVTTKPPSKSLEQFFRVISVPVGKEEGCRLSAGDNALIVRMNARPGRRSDLELLWMSSEGRDLHTSFARQHWKRCLTLNGLTVVHHPPRLQYPHTDHLHVQFWDPGDCVMLIRDLVLY